MHVSLELQYPLLPQPSVYPEQLARYCIFLYSCQAVAEFMAVHAGFVFGIECNPGNLSLPTEGMESRDMQMCLEDPFMNLSLNSQQPVLFQSWGSILPSLPPIHPAPVLMTNQPQLAESCASPALAKQPCQ